MIYQTQKGPERTNDSFYKIAHVLYTIMKIILYTDACSSSKYADIPPSFMASTCYHLFT